MSTIRTISAAEIAERLSRACIPASEQYVEASAYRATLKRATPTAPVHAQAVTDERNGQAFDAAVAAYQREAPNLNLSAFGYALHVYQEALAAPPVELPGKTQDGEPWKSMLRQAEDDLAKLRAASLPGATAAADAVTIPRVSAEKAVRAMKRCNHEMPGWDKYYKPIEAALADQNTSAEGAK